MLYSLKVIWLRTVLHEVNHFPIRDITDSRHLTRPPSHTGSCSPRQRSALTFLWCASETACHRPDRDNCHLNSNSTKSHLNIRFREVLSTLPSLVLPHLGEVRLGPEHVSPRPPQLLLPPLGLGQLGLDLVQNIARALTSGGGAHRRGHFWHGLKILILILMLWFSSWLLTL